MLRKMLFVFLITMLFGPVIQSFANANPTSRVDRVLADSVAYIVGEHRLELEVEKALKKDSSITTEELDMVQLYLALLSPAEIDEIIKENNLRPSGQGC